jgi:hypothetical protein
MENAFKLIDTIIKAPLWFFFAALVATSIPLLKLDFLMQNGATGKIEILGVPLVYYTILCFALFVSSAFAHAFLPISNFLSSVFDRLKWWLALAKLPEEARAILALMEEQNMEWLHYDPRNNAISLLRDKGIFQVDFMDSKGEFWGTFRLTAPYRTAYARHRTMFRAAMKYSHDASMGIRSTMQAARRAATNRV